MVYGCGNKCIKFCVFFFNLLICLAGAIIFGVSLWANLDKKFESYWEKLHTGIDISNYKVGVWILVAVGAFLFVTGFLGCCGAAAENQCLLGIFFTVVLICFILEVGGIIAAFVMKDKLKAEIKKGVDKSVDSQQGKDGLKELQDTLKCCGSSGAEIGGVTCNPSYVGTGCVDKLWDEIKSHAVIAGAVGAVVLLIELLAMIFACVMCSAIRTGKYGYA